MQRMKNVGLILAVLMTAGSGMITGGTMARAEEQVEEPAYDVVDTIGEIEIRQYGPRLAAEADMGPGSGVNQGQNAAFMALAGFIFAQNREGPEVAMTAPISVETLPEQIAMTAPVAMETGEEGRVMRFFMPAEYTLETLPQPGDDRVRILTVPAQTLAVLRFSGESTDAVVASRTTELLAGLEGSAWRPIADPGFFGYDPPMTPPDQRRNEVFVEVEAAEAGAATGG
jgi:hypothetical protein